MVSSNAKLDLTGVISPLCLLKCKSVLTGMESGHVLEVLLQDPGVVEKLVKIIERSQDQVMESKMEKDLYRICIKKGSKT
jgi:TusA-related sulfurtransferase